MKPLSLRRRLEKLERLHHRLELDRWAGALTDEELVEVLDKADPEVMAVLTTFSHEQLLRIMNGEPLASVVGDNK